MEWEITRTVVSSDHEHLGKLPEAVNSHTSLSVSSGKRGAGRRFSNLFHLLAR